MDYKDFVSGFTRVACILSVNLKETESSRRYIIVDANDAYKLTVVKNIEDFVTNVHYAYMKEDFYRVIETWSRLIFSLTVFLLTRITMPAARRYSTA